MEKDLDVLDFDDSAFLPEESIYDELESYYGDDLVDLVQEGGWG